MLNLKPSRMWFWKFCWAITPLILAAIFIIGCIEWEQPTFDTEKTVTYPPYVHYIGWCLTLVVGVQIPVIALIMIIYYAVKGDCLSVFQPTSEWGPGDKSETRAWHTHNYNKAMTCKQHPYASAAQGYPAAYDNYGMAYPAGATGSVPGYYAGPGGTF